MADVDLHNQTHASKASAASRASRLLSSLWCDRCLHCLTCFDYKLFQNDAVRADGADADSTHVGSHQDNAAGHVQGKTTDREAEAPVTDAPVTAHTINRLHATDASAQPKTDAHTGAPKTSGGRHDGGDAIPPRPTLVRVFSRNADEALRVGECDCSSGSDVGADSDDLDACHNSGEGETGDAVDNDSDDSCGSDGSDGSVVIVSA